MKLRFVSWAPAAVLMVAIFCFSHQEAGGSNESSLTIASSILNVYENSTNKSFDGDERLLKLGSINHVVRKMAHFSEYAVLAILVSFFLWTRNIKGVQLILLSIIFTSMYAVSDEIHQLFIPGRSGEVKDVFIDTLGGVIGSLIFYLFNRLVLSTKRK